MNPAVRRSRSAVLASSAGSLMMTVQSKSPQAPHNAVLVAFHLGSAGGRVQSVKPEHPCRLVRRSGSLDAHEPDELTVALIGKGLTHGGQDERTIHVRERV